LTALHEHNERQRSHQILAWLNDGLSVALISDAGTPLISDPGYHLVNAVLHEGHCVVPIPGANALITALSASGLPTDRFVFEGFLPAKQGLRRKTLQTLQKEARTLIFYESSHRIIDATNDLLLVMGEQREVVLARELTKLHEEFFRGRLSDLVIWLQQDNNHQRGEFVLLLKGYAVVLQDNERLSIVVDDLLLALLKELPVKRAAKLVAELSGQSKNKLYKKALKMR